MTHSKAAKDKAPATLSAFTRIPTDMLLRLLLLLIAGVTSSACTPPGAATRATSVAGAQPIEVTTLQGKVRGTASPKGQVFLGIPFAQAPQGPLRWREPLPVPAWSGIRDATHLGNACAQNLNPEASTGRLKLPLTPVLGSEDCLNLNVYAPADAASGKALPVLVWLYGGALILGNNRQYDPSLLAERTQSLVVTPNYRLGTLGFLSHPALRAQAGGAANLGLLDQQAALHWVQDNISPFGGDPKRVTLLGESAGAWSVCAQLASPGARGLFQRAIIQSGACNLTASTVSVAQADAGGQRLATALGCADQDPASCLRQQSVRRLLAQPAPTPGILGQHSWTFIAGDSVLPQPPAQVFAAGRQMPVPILIGTNADEGRLFEFLLGNLGRLKNQDRYAAMMRDIFGSRADAVMNRYTPARFGSLRNAFAQAITEGVFVCPTLALGQSLEPTNPTWIYQFNDPNAPFALARKPIGAYHSGELVYVFGTPWVLANPKHWTPEQRQLSQRMQADWGHFARFGSLAWRQDGGQPWHPYTTQRAGSEPTAEPDASGCDFWRKTGI